MDTIGMDTNSLVAGASDAVGDPLDARDRALIVGGCRGGGGSHPPPRAIFRPAVVRRTTAKTPAFARLAYICSPRDNKIGRTTTPVIHHAFNASQTRRVVVEESLPPPPCPARG